MCPEPENRVCPPAHDEWLALFDEMPFAERMRRMISGLRAPHDSGAYKFARLQRQRLSAPFAAGIAPLLALVVLLLLGAVKRDTKPMGGVVKIYDRPREKPALTPLPKPEPSPDTRSSRSILEPVFEPVMTSSAPLPLSPQQVHPGRPVRWLKPVGFKGPDQGIAGVIAAALPPGGGPSTEKAVMKALRWLKVEQLEDGSWPKQRTAMTGLALLTYLAHGETAASVEFGRTVERAGQFLVSAQQTDGRFRPRDGHDYTHPIATYALCEAFKATPTPSVRRAAKRALAVIIRGQHPTGGWTYNLDPQAGAGGSYRDDTSYMGWCIQALVAGYASGLEVDGLEAAMTRAVEGVCGNGREDGGFGYTSPGRTGLTGVGVLCLELLGAGDRPAARRGAALLQEASLDWDAWAQQPYSGGSPVYYWYYVTQVKFKAGGTVWDRWNRQMRTELVSNQVVINDAATDAEGRPVDIGYWDSPSASEHSDGRVQDTCLTALQLEVYYRGLISFQHRDAWVRTPALDKNDIPVNIIMGEDA